VFAASVGVEVATHFERIELRVSDVDRPAMEAPALRGGSTLRTSSASPFKITLDAAQSNDVTRIFPLNLTTIGQGFTSAPM
jgi:hypothetical protein